MKKANARNNRMENLQMKKIVLFLMLTSALFVAGCNNFSIGKQYTDEEYKQAEEVAKTFIETNYEAIESVKIEHVGDDKESSKSILVEGYANNVPFSIQVTVEDMKVYAIGTGEDFPERKEEYKDKVAQ